MMAPVCALPLPVELQVVMENSSQNPSMLSHAPSISARVRVGKTCESLMQVVGSIRMTSQLHG